MVVEFRLAQTFCVWVWVFGIESSGARSGGVVVVGEKCGVCVMKDGG